MTSKLPLSTARPSLYAATGSASRCELRPGIGLCDCCGEAKWPQEYQGYGCMICLDCLDHKRHTQNYRGQARREKI